MDRSEIPPSVPNAMQIPCLGRPFQLGMLYDCRDDRLVTGVTLWNHDTLKESLDCRSHESTQFSIVAEDTIDQKTSSLGVEAGLKLSLLGGLINVSGSAKFLENERSSKKQARVSLKYSMTSSFEQLTMNHLATDKVQHPTIFDKGDATHVVTGILYGAEAFFVFDREVSENERLRDIHGRMAIMIKKLPSISIGGDGQLDIKDTEKSEVQKFQCQFHGDLVLKENPTNFQEAVKIYKQLPQMLAIDNATAKVVPKIVWLYPLCKLDNRAAQIVREISVGLVNQTQKMIQDLRECKMRATDLKNSEVYANFPRTQQQLSHFIEMIAEYETDTAKKISMVLPAIRGGGEEEAKLAELLQNHNSPFNQHSLSSWLSGKEQGEKLLKVYLKGLQCDAIHFAFLAGELDAIIMDLDIDRVLCFAFKIAGSHDSFLEAMFNYLRTNEASLEYAQANTKHWFQDRRLTNEMKAKAKIFKTFAITNANTEGTKFVVTDVSEDDVDVGSEGAEILLYSGGPPESYEPAGKPGKPEVSSVTHDTITLSWSKPKHGSETIKSYTVYCCQQDESDASKEWKEQTCTAESIVFSNIKPETTYVLKVRAHCEIGVSEESEFSDPVKTERSPLNRLALMFKDSGTLEFIERKEGLDIYKLPLCPLYSDQKGVAKFCIGSPDYLTAQHKERVVMVVGAKGSGKSTLINGIANYVMGVKWEDNFRFKLIIDGVNDSQAFSQTQTILTAYSFPAFEELPLPYQLTVVDTPGFGDTRGLERDEQITAQIKHFFSLSSSEGIHHVDGIGFVAQSPLARLTHTQKYIIDSILSVFGKDIGGNIFMMTTFADGAYPPVMDAIKTHIDSATPPIPIKVDELQYFKFNNSALFAKPLAAQQSSSLRSAARKPGFDEMYWEVGYTNFRQFFTHLGQAIPQTLSLTRDVLDEREKLQMLIQSLKENIHKAMNSIDKMRAEKTALEGYEAKIRANEDYTYEVTEYHMHMEALPQGTYTVNCLNCNHACHYPCNSGDKRDCSAMDSSGNCKICPGHCKWHCHRHNDFHYILVEVAVTKRYAQMERKYWDAKKGKATAESMMLKIKDQAKGAFKKVREDIGKAQQCLERLEKIALKPNPLTELQYIDLIKSEKNEAKPGWEKRVKCYEKAREMAVIMADARKGKLADHMNLEALMDDLLKEENP